MVRCSHCEGLVKPDIVFFGEGLPEDFFLLQRVSLVVRVLTEGTEED